MANTQLQRRHFEAIATIIYQFPLDEEKKLALATDFANKLHKYNSNFDYDRFVTAATTGKMGRGRSHKDV